MNSVNRIKLWSAPFVLGAMTLNAAVDQQYPGPFDVGDFCCEIIGRNSPIGQSFQVGKGVEVISRVDVHLQNLSAQAKDVSILLRRGSATGDILALLGTVSVPHAPFHGWVSLQGFCPVGVNPAHTYTLELVQVDGRDDVRWSLKTGGDAYPKGEAWRDGLQVPWDYGFRTHYRTKATSGTVSVTDVNHPLTIVRGQTFTVAARYALTLNPAGSFASTFAVTKLGDVLTGHQDRCADFSAQSQLIEVQVVVPLNFPVGQYPLSTQVGVIGGSISSGPTRNVIVQ